MTASLFGVNGNLINANVSGTLVPQSFTATAGQTLFTITTFTYTPGTHSLLVCINGNLQVVGRDFVETSSTSFTLLTGVVAGDFVDVIGFPALSLSAFPTGIINTNLTLLVPLVYPTIAAALAFVGQNILMPGVTVTIQVADGVYILTAGIIVNHPQGSQIQILGNLVTPANCTLTLVGVPTFDLFTVLSKVGRIAGFYTTLTAKAGLVNNATAFLAVNGGSINQLDHCITNNWYYQVAARAGSFIQATNITSSNAGDVAIWAFDNSTIVGNNIAVSGANDSANNLGDGFQAEYGSLIDVTACTATTCYRSGFAALSSGVGRYYTNISSGNVGSGFRVQAGGVIEGNGSTSTLNSKYGIEFSGGAGACTGLASNTLNTLGVDNGSVYLDNSVALGARIAANGDFRIDLNGNNNWYFNSPGGVQLQIAHTAATIHWPYLTGSATSGAIYTTGGAANGDVSLNANGTGFVFLGANKANYVRINGQAAGTAPQLRAEGVDANINLIAGGKGTGVFGFGTYNATADVVCNGYIPIVDSAGNARKLMTTA